MIPSRVHRERLRCHSDDVAHEPASDLAGGVAITGPGGLRIERQCDLGAGVAEPGLDGLHVDPLDDEVGGGQAPEIMAR